MLAQLPTATALIWPQALPQPLPRFLLLAALLHVWLVLMLGNAPGGTAAQGKGVFGSLNITLQGSPDGRKPEEAPPALPPTPTGEAGDAARQRFGGAVRSALPDPQAQPGAARLGDWAPRAGQQPDGLPAADAAAAVAPQPETPQPRSGPPEPTPVRTLQGAAPLPVPVPTPAELPTAAAEPPSAVLGSTRLLSPRAGAEDALALAAPATAVTELPLPSVPSVPSVGPAPLKQVSAAPLAPAPVPQAALRSSTTVPLPDNPLLAAVPQPSATLPPASAERQLTPRLTPGRSGALPALPETNRATAAPVLAAVPAPDKPVAAAAPPALAPKPPVAPPPVPAAVPALAAAPAASSRATAPELGSVPSPAAAPLPATPAAEPVGPQLARRMPAPSATGPQPALPPSAAATAGVFTPLPSVPQPSSLVPLGGQGAPDAGSRVGHDVATAPSNAASAPKKLNLELPRLRGGELSRHSTTGILPALPRPPEVPDKLGNAIEKAAKEDCRKAYAGAGLLAVVPLAVDALREGGCKW